MKAAVFGDPTVADDTENFDESNDYADIPEYVNNRYLDFFYYYAFFFVSNKTI